MKIAIIGSSTKGSSALTGKLETRKINRVNISFFILWLYINLN